MSKTPAPLNSVVFSNGIRIIETTVVIIGGGRTTDKIIKSAKKLSGGKKLRYINPNINQDDMPSGNGHRKVVILEWFEFDHDPTIKEVNRKCRQMGYDHPTYGDGLRWQETYPSVKLEYTHIIIPEEPLCFDGSLPLGLFLSGDGNASSRQLCMDFCILDRGWPLPCVFARRKLPVTNYKIIKS